MPKTPDEIKKGLELCVIGETKCEDGCSYCETEYPYCMGERNADALALIQQLEAERDAAVKDIERTCSTCKHYYYNNDEGCEYDCVVGPDGCHNGNTKWQWRGVQKEE